MGDAILSIIVVLFFLAYGKKNIDVGTKKDIRYIPQLSSRPQFNIYEMPYYLFKIARHRISYSEYRRKSKNDEEAIEKFFFNLKWNGYIGIVAAIIFGILVLYDIFVGLRP